MKKKKNEKKSQYLPYFRDRIEILGGKAGSRLLMLIVLVCEHGCVWEGCRESGWVGGWMDGWMGFLVVLIKIGRERVGRGFADEKTSWFFWLWAVRR